MLYGIQHRHTGTTLFSGEYDSLKACTEAAAKARANLAGANLTGADLARAKSVPEPLASQAAALEIETSVVRHIDASILRAIELGGTLDMSQWHGGETTHCRLGWAISLAGEAGAKLEDRFGSRRAGAMIYRASRPGQHAPWVFASDDKAMADIKASAAADPL